MDELQTFWTVMLAICASITAIGGATAVIAKFVKPYQNIKASVENLKLRMDRNDERWAAQEKQVSANEKIQRVMLKGQLQMINHMIYGNHTEQLHEVMQEMQDCLIEH